MTHILKYLSSFLLAFMLIGCQNDNDTDSSKEMAQQSPQQEQTQQQPNQMGQMQQQTPAPDIDVSDEEVESFVDASVDARKVQVKAQQKMVGIIEDEGLDVETYQKIAKSKQPGQTKQKADVSEDEMEKYENATKSLRKAQGKIQQDIAATIEENGIEMQRFQQIGQAAQQDRELQQKIQKKMQEKMQGAQGRMQQPSDN